MADTSKAPERIWLQEPVGLEYERSWCAEQISDDDTPYVRADLYDAAQAKVARLTAALAEMTRRRDAWKEKAGDVDALRASVRAGIEEAGTANLSRIFLRGALHESERSLAECKAALADAETRGKEAGLREAVTICKHVRNEVAESEEEAAGALECAVAIMDAVNALPPRERDGQEGG